MGVDSGYTQKDVTELARMLTGWTYDNRELAARNRTFTFDASRHDHDDKLWLGPAASRPAGTRRASTRWTCWRCCRPPAHHLSFQLAQYFVQDQPPPALVDRMAKSYIDSKGDIRSVLRTLFASAEFMAPEAVGAKFKTPYQYVISAARAPATRRRRTSSRRWAS